jgi:hypothetical protein
MKLLLFPGLAFLLLAAAGCSKEDSPTGPKTPKETGINIVNMAPVFPASLKYYKTADNDRVTISFNYIIAEAEGARIWIQPVKDTDEGTSYYSSSPVYKGSGSKSVIISADSDENSLHISKLRIVIKTPDQSSTIYESFMDVDYTFTK